MSKYVASAECGGVRALNHIRGIKNGDDRQTIDEYRGYA